MVWSSALVTGGLGFIGSNLARALRREGVTVHILDSAAEEYGANLFNLSGIRDEVHLHRVDIRDGDDVDAVVEACDPDTVFHLAAQLSRTESLENPQKDIEINCRGTVNVLEAIRERAPDARVVFASSQAVYGVPESLPLTEATEPDPIDIYGANKLAGEQYCRVYDRVHDLETSVLRLTNVYGPRAQLTNPKYGVINRFIRLALTDQRLPVFEPGEMQRDFVYVDDVTDAMLSVVETPACRDEIYLVTSGESTSILDLAETVTEISGGGRVELVEWPESWDSIRIGDIRTDSTKLQADTDWQPETSLREGLDETISFYRSNESHYIDT